MEIKITTLVSLSLIFAFCGTLDSYASTLPSRYDKTSDNNCTVDMTAPVDRFEFEIFFYFGKGLGSLVAGSFAYIFTPNSMVLLVTNLTVAFGLLSASLSEVANSSAAVTYLIWFFLPFLAYAHFTVRFIHTLESVEVRWINYVGLGLFGLQWQLASLYDKMARKYFQDWHYRIIITTAIFFCLTTLQENTMQLRREDMFENAPKESLKTLIKSKRATRYFIILIFLWFIHGANAKLTYGHSIESLLFVCLGKVMVTFLCQWTGQKRAVMAALLALNSIVCFCCTAFQYTLLYNISYKEADHGYVLASLYDVWEFLNLASLCILWLWTIEIFGCGSRYLVLGVGSLAGQFGLWCAVYFLDNMDYLGWPSGILGGLCVLSVGLCFLLPEPKRTGLPLRTRKIYDKDNGSSDA